jgi:hypothetical protein
MTTILKPCRVPWSVSSTMSGLTLAHAETDAAPECEIVFGGGRLGADGLVDSRRIALTFERAWYARAAPLPDDADIDAAGFIVEGGYDGPMTAYLDWLKRRWRETGICPHPDFYVATSSDWLAGTPYCTDEKTRHYVLHGRDGFIEILAERFAWREWLWTDGEREEAPRTGSVAATGAGIE